MTLNQKNWSSILALCFGILALGIWIPTRPLAMRVGIFCILVLIVSLVKNNAIPKLLNGS